VTLSVPDVPAIDVYAKSGSQGDIVDSMYTFVTEHCHMSLLVDPLADLFNLGESRIRTVVRSTEERFSFFPFIDSYQSPSEVVVNRGSLPGCQTPPMIEYASSSGIWRRFIANRSLRGVKALAGTETGELMSFSRTGLRCRRISDSDEYPLIIPSTS